MLPPPECASAVRHAAVLLLLQDHMIHPRQSDAEYVYIISELLLHRRCHWC